MKKVAIIMGSDSDLPVVEKGISVLKEYGVPFEVHVYSAHRTPEEAAQFSKSARENGSVSSSPLPAWLRTSQVPSQRIPHFR